VNRDVGGPHAERQEESYQGTHFNLAFRPGHDAPAL
jgi:hypothetical protein